MEVLLVVELDYKKYFFCKCIDKIIFFFFLTFIYFNKILEVTPNYYQIDQDMKNN
jgi:hypothetical protein